MRFAQLIIISIVVILPVCRPQFSRSKGYFIDIKIPDHVNRKGEGRIQIKIKPLSPYKISIEAPFKLKILQKSDLLIFKETILQNDSRSVKISEKLIESTLHFRAGNQTGKEQVDINLRFYLCTPKMCILRSVKIQRTLKII
jgi:hypothetical protein